MADIACNSLQLISLKYGMPTAAEAAPTTCRTQNGVMAHNMSLLHSPSQKAHENAASAPPLESWALFGQNWTSEGELCVKTLAQGELWIVKKLFTSCCISCCMSLEMETRLTAETGAFGKASCWIVCADAKSTPSPKLSRSCRSKATMHSAPRHLAQPDLRTRCKSKSWLPGWKESDPI